MEVNRNDPPPVEQPPATYDITGLTEREAGALRNVLMARVVWSDQDKETEAFFRSLYRGLAGAPVVHLSYKSFEEDGSETA